MVFPDLLFYCGKTAGLLRITHGGDDTPAVFREISGGFTADAGGCARDKI